MFTVKEIIRISTILTALVFAIECKGADTSQMLIELPVKPAIPTLVLPDRHGNRIDINTLESPVLVVNFWATWCSSCVSEMKSIDHAARYLSDKNVKVLTVNVGESHYKIINYFREYEPAYIVLADYQSVSAKRWQLQGLPTTYVIGPDRKIHYGAIGLLNWKSQTMLNQIVALSQ